MVSSCTTCTTTRLVLISTSSRSRQVRGGSSIATPRSNRFPEFTTLATAYQGGIVKHGSTLAKCNVSTTAASTTSADFSSLSGVTASKSTGAVAGIQDSSYQSSAEDASSGWNTSELVLSSLFAIGMSVSFLLGAAATSAAPSEVTRSGPWPSNPRGGGPQSSSTPSLLASLATVRDQNVSVNEDVTDVFAMGARIPYDVSVSALQGERESMEDEYFVAKGGRFAAVYDGHGGGGVSSTLRKRLFPLFNHHLRMIHEDEADGNDTRKPSIMSYVTAFNKAFTQLDSEIQGNERLSCQGSTAVAVAIHEGVNGFRTLVSGNVGDSRAILSRRGRAVDLTRDHKPNEEGEKARILGMGGTIQWDPYGKVHRVVNLSTSRAIGDRYARPMVSGQVEIKQFPFMEDRDEFILLASDGLWDVMTSQEVVDFIHQHLNGAEKSGSKEDKAKRALLQRRNMARCVAKESIRRGSMDNVTVLIVWLREL